MCNISIAKGFFSAKTHGATPVRGTRCIRAARRSVAEYVTTPSSLCFGFLRMDAPDYSRCPLVSALSYWNGKP
jgi:hypothetical protein